MPKPKAKPESAKTEDAKPEAPRPEGWKPGGKDAAALKQLVLEVPDFPKKGIGFKDITPLLADPEGFNAVVEGLMAPYKQKGIEVVAGIESRGFLLAPALAARMGAGVVPLRKKGKLPRKVHSESYALEYGTDSIEAHVDAFPKGTKVLLVDDVLATGGTAAAGIKLIESLGGLVIGTAFLIELSFLNGRKKLADHDIHSLITY